MTLDFFVGNYSAELSQWNTSLLSATVSLIYTEYVRKMVQKLVPGQQHIYCAPLTQLGQLLSTSGPFMTWLSDDVVSRVIYRSLIQDYIDVMPDIIKSEECSNLLNEYVHTRYLPILSETIIHTIGSKLNLGKPESMFIENGDIVLFGGEEFPTSNDIDFLVDQLVIRLLMTIPAVEKRIILVRNNESFMVKRSTRNKSILSIKNDHAISVIYFSDSVIQNGSMMDKLSYVTSTDIDSNDEGNAFHVSTSPFNQAAIIELL